MSHSAADAQLAGRKRLNTRSPVVRAWQLYLMLALPVIYLAVFNYYPMLGIQIAFKDFKPRLGIWGSPWVGFKNFLKFIDSYKFWPIIKNTLYLSFYSIVAMIPMPIILALSALGWLAIIQAARLLRTAVAG